MSKITLRLGPYATDCYVTFIHSGEGGYRVYFTDSDPGKNKFASSFFVLRAGARAILTCEQFEFGPDDDLNCHVTFEQLAASFDTTADTDPIPAGFCTGTKEQCPGIYSPCGPTQVLEKVGDVCECTDPQGGG